MTTITICGSSDDLIEVDGDINAEFSSQDDLPNYLFFSDGTVLSAKYDSGIWRINKVFAGSSEYSKIEATDADEKYSDRVTLTGNIKYVGFGAEVWT